MYPKKTCLLIMFLMTVVTTTACGGPLGRASSTPTPLPPIVSYEKAIFTVERGSIVSEKDLLALIVPSKQEDLFFRSTGYITRILVKVGDMVKQNDLLAELQVEDLYNQLEQAKIDLEVAQASLAKEESERKYAIERAKIDVINWEKRVELARIDLEQAYTITDQTRAQLYLEITEQNLVLAKLALEQANEETSTYAQQAVQRNQLAVQRLETLIRERQIIAPFDGIILKSTLRPGQQVEAFNVVMGIGDPTKLVLRVQYDYDLGSTLNKNSEVYLYLNSEHEGEAYPVKYLPNFIPISTSDVAKNVFTADYLYFSAPEGLPEEDIATGKTTYLMVILGRKEDALLLPPAAIRTFGGNNFVIILEGDRRRRVEIPEIGLKTLEKWEVIADLQEGDQILGP